MSSALKIRTLPQDLLGASYFPKIVSVTDESMSKM